MNGIGDVFRNSNVAMTVLIQDWVEPLLDTIKAIGNNSP